MLSACSGSEEGTEETTIEDNSDVAEEAEAEEIEDEWEDPYYDTIFFGEIESKYNKPQLDNNTFYAYWGPVIPLFNDIEHTESDVQLNVGDKVTLIEKTGQRMESNGFKGEIYKVSDGVNEGYCNSALLSNFPYPGNTDMLGYCLETLHLTEPVQFTQRLHREYPDAEGSHSEATYKFESGIVLYRSESYEAGSTHLYIPDISVTEALILMDVFWYGKDLSDLTDNQLPKIGQTELESEYEYEYNSIDVETDETGNPIKIEYTFEEGCSNWCIAQYDDGGAVIKIGGGC